MQMSNDIKIFGGIILATVVLIVGAIFFFGKDGGTVNPSNTTPVKVKSEILTRKDSWSEGPANAKVTMVEFGDFQCPACKVQEPIIKTIMKTYKDKVRFVWRNFPLTQVHEFAFDSSLAAEAAGKQGKFWQYHDKLFSISPSLQKDKLMSLAKDLGLNMDQFTSDLNSDAVRQRVLDDQADGAKANIQGTPTIFINGKQLINHSDPNVLPQVGDFQQEIDAILK